MPLELPTLDDRRYADLMDEALRLIPVYDPDWTNHNPSDPGITLIELLAWLTEMLLYRLDRVTAEHQRKFLALLNGPDWRPGTDLSGDIRDTIQSLRSRERAVTAADYERLATIDFNRWLVEMRQTATTDAARARWQDVTGLDPEVTPPGAVSAVARATCVPGRNLSRATAQERAAAAPANLSLILVPQGQGDQDRLLPDPALIAALWGWLDERRMLTTRHHVVGAWFAPVSPEIFIAAQPGALVHEVAARVIARLAAFLDPRAGGQDGSGWPFGRDVFVSEVVAQLEQVPGVDYIADLWLAGDCSAGQARCIPAEPLWHAEGDQIGLALRALQLPIARLDPARILVVPAADCLSVILTLDLTPAPGGDVGDLKRQLKAAARDFFHPLHAGPGPSDPMPTPLRLADLGSTLAALPGVVELGLGLDAPTARPLLEGDAVVGIEAGRGQVIGLATRFGALRPDGPWRARWRSTTPGG